MNNIPQSNLTVVGTASDSCAVQIASAAEGTIALRHGSHYHDYTGPSCTGIQTQGLGTPIASDRKMNIINLGHRKTYIPALSSAKRWPTRSECFKNLSAQFKTHCS